jgi:hypothetical protein
MGSKVNTSIKNLFSALKFKMFGAIKENPIDNW